MRAATVAELAWRDPAGRLDALPVVPLQLDAEPALAYPYAHMALARELAAAPLVALVLSDPRMSGPGWSPLAALGRLRLVEDSDGTLFTGQLLAQELRKYPPSRALADSPLLRRENWWYLPRLVLALDVAAVVPVGARREPRDQVLALSQDPDRLHVDTVRVEEAGQDLLRVRSLAGRVVPSGPALLLGHDFSEPDLERWTSWATGGNLTGGILAVRRRPDRTTLAPAPGLWQRLRRHRDLERACRAGLAAVAR